MKTLLIFTLIAISLNSFAQKTIPIKNAHDMALAMDNGSFVGTSSDGASVRISEFVDHIILKNYTANSEIKITDKKREEKTTEKATGLAYSGNYKSHPVGITMVVQDDKIRARIRIGEQKMVVVGVVKSNASK